MSPSAQQKRGAARILSVSYYEPGLETRKHVLAQAGFEVINTTRVEEATALCQREDYDAAVLGDSIPLPVRMQLAADLRGHCPNMPVVLMTRPGEDCRGDGHYCTGSLDGPAALLATIQRAINEAEQEAAS